jgi:hypothetical protein
MRFLEPMTPSERPNRQFLEYSAIKRLETPPSCAGATGVRFGSNSVIGFTPEADDADVG